MHGYLVGNGVFDFETAAGATVPFAYGHSFIGDAQNAAVTKACDGNYLKPSAACTAQLNAVQAQYVDTNGYDAYRTCYHPAGADADAVTGNPAALTALFAGGELFCVLIFYPISILFSCLITAYSVTLPYDFPEF